MQILVSCELKRLFQQGKDKIVKQPEVTYKIKIYPPKPQSNKWSIDPPGHSRIGGHYFHAGCPSVRPSQKQKRYNANNGTRKTKYALRRTPCMKIMTF